MRLFIRNKYLSRQVCTLSSPVLDILGLIAQVLDIMVLDIMELDILGTTQNV